MLRDWKNDLVGAIAQVTFATLVVFVLMHVVSDPASTALGKHATPESIMQFNQKHGLDQPLSLQYWQSCKRLFSGLTQGDWGHDLYQRPIGPMLSARIPRSLLLGAFTLFLECVLGALLGWMASLGLLSQTRWGRVLDQSLLNLTVLFSSLPSLILGPVLLLAFAYRWPLFPFGGIAYFSNQNSILANLSHLAFQWETWHYLCLPAIALALIGMVPYFRLVRKEALGLRIRSVLMAAESRGASPLQRCKHLMAMTWTPVIGMLGLHLPLLASGAFITETIFHWPGMGMLFVQSIQEGNFPLCMILITLFSIMIQAGQLGCKWMLNAFVVSTP